MRFLFFAYRDVKNPAAVGGDQYLWELAKGAARLKNKVTFVCSMFDNSEEEERVDGVDIVRLRGNGRLPQTLFMDYLRRWRGTFDIVVEEAIGGQRPPFLAALYVREPLIAVWYQRHFKIFREQYPFPIWGLFALLELLLAQVYRNRIILTLSQGTKQELIHLGFQGDQIKVVFPGVGESFENATTNRKREDTIVCLGKLRRYKRFDHAILALKRIKSKVERPVRLVIAGKVSEIDRDYVESLRELTERLRLGDSVEFRFNLSESEKLELLEKSRLLIAPSPVEGFSIVVAEANRCGTPVVVSDGLPGDVVINGQNGFVYPFGDIEAMADDVIELISDNELWRKMSTRAWQLSKRFSYEDSALEFIKIAKQLPSS